MKMNNVLMGVLLLAGLQACAGERNELVIDYPLDSMEGGTVINSVLYFRDAPVVVGVSPGERISGVTLTFQGVFHDVIVTSQTTLEGLELVGHVSGEVVDYDVPRNKFPAALVITAPKGTALASVVLTVTPAE